MDAVTIHNKSSVDDNDEDAFAVFDNLDKSDSMSECNKAIKLNATREANQVQDIPSNVNIQTISEHTQQVLRGDDSYKDLKHNKLTEKQQQKQESQHVSHDNGITVLSYVNKMEDGDDSKENVHCSNSCNNNITHISNSKDISCSNSVNKLWEIKLEKNSNIRVKRCTRSFDQLPVLLAQYPFATFSQLCLLSTKCYNDTANTSYIRSSSSSSCSNNNKNSTLARCCVGVVSYRGEPKQNHKNTSQSMFAVIRIWNMHGFSPSSSEELALLLCSSAFDILYSQLMLGSVIAVVNLSLLSFSSSSSSFHHANNIGTSNTKHDGLYRVHDIEQIRLLGYAAELGTCNAISKNSQERCHNLVNTHISQYCIYHLNEVKKVARGATNVNDNKTVPMNIINKNKNNIAITSNQSSYVFAHNQRTPLVPVSASSSSSQLLNVSRQQSSASRTAILKQPSFLIVKGNNGLPVHSPATQHRMNVCGNNNNINSECTNNNTYENKMYGEGIYAGVCKGSALSIKNKINSSFVSNALDKTLHTNNPVSNNSNNINCNNIHNTLYPAMSVHNITTRGRDVLAIAQQQEDARQQARLLRSALYTTTSSATNNNNLSNDNNESVGSKNKAMSTNLHVAANGERNLPSEKNEQQRAKRVRADDSAQLEEKEKRKRNITRIESGNTKIKRSRKEEKVENKTERSSENELASKSAYQSRQTMKRCHKINDELIRAVKEQCGPLSSTPLVSSELNNLSSNVYFVPEANNMERVELVIDYQNTNSNDSNKQEASNKNVSNENVNRRKCNSANAKKQIITQTLSGHRSALVNTVAKAIRNKVILPLSTSSTSQLLNTQKEKQLNEEWESTSLEQTESPHLQHEASSPFSLLINNNKNIDKKNNISSTAITLLGEIASQMHSAHNSLRNEAEINRLNAQLDKSIAQEKAIALLTSIHEQPIDATYCYECNSWSTKALDSCVKARHRLEVKQTVKRFIECEYCHYKTFVLGNEADRASHAWKLLPLCPRCHQRCI